MADDQKKKQNDSQIVDGEVLAEYDDHTLLNLPSVPDDTNEQQSDIEDTQPSAPGRRQFMLNLLLGGGAAVALGGSAAFYAASRQTEPTMVVMPNGAEFDPNDSTDVARLAERLAIVEAELETVTAERDQLSLELDDARRALVDVQQLNALWNRHDEVGIDTLLAGGLAVLAAGFGNLLTLVTNVLDGVERGGEVITAFIEALPGPADGIRWLTRQVLALSNGLNTLAQTVEDIVESENSVVSMLAEFVIWLMDKLPFGAGNSAKAGLEAMQSLINELPTMVDRVNSDVLNPLADWLGDDDNVNFTGILLRPIEQFVIEPASTLADDVSGFQETYQAEFAAPVSTALSERSTIKAEIEVLQARLESRGRAI